jgi:diacylglycerol kinase (ATP)
VSLEAPDVSVYADGEPMGSLPVTCETVPGAVQVLA